MRFDIKRYSGEAAVLLAAVMWGTIGFFTRNLIDIGFSPIQIVAVRAFITSFTMLVIILIINPKLLKIKLKHIWMFIGTGIFSFMFFNICYMNSIAENSLSVACILMYTSPVWVTAFSAVFFKERVTIRKTVCLSVCLLGCLLVCMSASLKYTGAGLVFGLLSGLGYALYSVFGKVASKNYDSLTIVFYTFLFSLAGLLPFAQIKDIVDLTAVNGVNAVMLFGISIINTLLPYVLYTFGLTKIEAGRAAVISIIEPVSSAVTGLVFFGERIGVAGFIGMTAVMAGLYFLATKKEEINA